jgi:hypothetical protein
MSNPFGLRWLQGWTFQTVLMEGHVQIEAHGYGIRLRTPLQPGESPRAAADRLVLEEDRRRRSLYQAWRRGQRTSALVPQTTDGALLPLSQPEAEPLGATVPSRDILFARDSRFAQGSPFLAEIPVDPTSALAA